jgi:glycosyltransferase involved in cell wall biosynthesis
MATRTSLVITTYNWPEALALCLRSVAGQRVLPYDVVVADDGSRPDTGQLVREFARDFPVPLHHAWQEDAGFRAARVRNLGIAATLGDYVVFVDGDMVLHPDFVADHQALIRPGSYLLGGRLNASQVEAARLLAGGAAQFSVRMPFAPRGSGGELKRKHALRLPLLAAYKASRRKGGVTMSCNLGVWRSDLVRINGFDHDYEGWGREDDDLALRLRHSGVERRLLRYAGLAIHLWHPTRWPDGVPPNQTLPNDVLLQRTRATRATRCARGLDSLIASVELKGAA